MIMVYYNTLNIIIVFFVSAVWYAVFVAALTITIQIIILITMIVCMFIASELYRTMSSVGFVFVFSVFFINNSIPQNFYNYAQLGGDW